MKYSRRLLENGVDWVIDKFYSEQYADRIVQILYNNAD